MGQAHRNRTTHRKRPLTPRDHALDINGQQVTAGLRTQQHLVLPLRQINTGQHRPPQPARVGVQRLQSRARPRRICITALNGHNLRVQSGQTLRTVAGLTRHRQQGQRSQNGVMLHHALAQQPVRNAGVGVKQIVLPGQLPARKARRTGERQQHPAKHPGDRTALGQAHGAPSKIPEILYF